MLAKAKINLMLHVTGKRQDGYHELQSLVVFADTGDELRYEDAEEFSLGITGPYAAELTGGHNLVAKAAEALAATCKKTLRGRITLTKNLPVASGIGGGSADAAAALHLLNKEWACGFSTSELAEIGAKIGSDVPACVHGTPLWMENTGDKITPVTIDCPLFVLLVNPGKSLATASVFAALPANYHAPAELASHFSTREQLMDFLWHAENNLENAAITLEPAVKQVLASLEPLAGCELARMSGSGATCFGIFASDDACGRAAESIQQAHPDWWVKATRI